MSGAARISESADALTEAPSRGLARFAQSLSYDDIPEAVRDRGKYLILDSLGIALASTTYPFAERVQAGVEALSDGPGACTVIGSDRPLALRDAVMMNGVLMHGLDFDDTHMTGLLHASVACLPAALGVAEQLDASGKDFLTAYAVGMESGIRIGASVDGGFHHVGFHATGIVAHFASALSVGRLYGLDLEQLVAAQGVSGSTAAAIQVFLESGAWTKRLHPGWAAVGGITSARLAQHGFEAPERVYEGRYGLFHTHLQDLEEKVDYAAITDGLGENWEISNVAIKPYPVCHFIHGCADAAIELYNRQSFASEDIVGIRAFVAEDTLPIVTEPIANKKEPANEYDAKFSTQFVVAGCLARGRFGLAELKDDALQDEEILRLSRMVDCVADPDSEFPTYFSGGVAVTTRSGEELTSHVRMNSGAGERALDGAAIAEKFMANATLAVSEDRATALQDAILGLDQRPVRELTALLHGKA